jgi:3-deoxy-D-manno-octulosonate 8-phosphate phosphatase (KDO 8-P phosphatase)
MILLEEMEELNQNITTNNRPKFFILDVDGVMTSGQFFYSENGKEMKIFGPDDNDGLSLLLPYLSISFVTGDRKGFPISKKRISDDMNFDLDLVSTIKRIDWIKERFNPAEVIYMGDGIFDHYVMQNVGYSIAPKNADENAKKNANYVTSREGGNRAVAEACLHILEKFFTPYNPNVLPTVQGKLSGEWDI